MQDRQRILVITDLGPAGDEAVRIGSQRAARPGAELAVVYPSPSLERARPVASASLADGALREALAPARLREALARRVARYRSPDGTELFVEEGEPTEVALATAARWGATLLVTGAGEDAAVDAKRLIRHGSTPVLVARSGPTRGPVVACTDFSDPSLPAVRAAADEARRTCEPLHVIHALAPLPVTMIGIEGRGVVSVAEWRRSFRAEAESRLAQVLSAVDTAGDYVAVDGPVVPSLAATARALGASLLVLGSVGRGGANRFMLGTVAESLLGAASCPTLVVPAGVASA
ncbi:MAG TPA: universal stress protein [Kofleriaceae bacterium]|nr:universal stress protein [Kofleriaceae bacterium]